MLSICVHGLSLVLTCHGLFLADFCVPPPSPPNAVTWDESVCLFGYYLSLYTDLRGGNSLIVLWMASAMAGFLRENHLQHENTTILQEDALGNNHWCMHGTPLHTVRTPP